MAKKPDKKVDPIDPVETDEAPPSEDAKKVDPLRDWSKDPDEDEG